MWNKSQLPVYLHHSYRALLFLTLVVPACAQLPIDATPSNIPANIGTAETQKRDETGSVHCTVQDNNGNPLRGASVTLRSSGSLVVVAAGETGLWGENQWEVPLGFYDVRANYSQFSTSRVVKVDRFGVEVILRLPTGSSIPGDSSTRSPISVSQLKVPEKAKGEFENAIKAVRNNDLATAQVHLQRALNIAPTFSEALMWLGIISTRQHRFDLACAQLQLAIQNNPSLAMAYFALASVYNNTARYQEARQAVDRGLPLNPQAWQAYYEGARADMGKGDFESALRHLSQAETLAPPQRAPLVLLNRAYALFRTGHGEEAAAILKTYISKNPTAPHAVRARELLRQIQHAQDAQPDRVRQ